MEIKVIVWNGAENREVKGHLLPFKEKEKIEYPFNTYKEKETQRTADTEYKKVKLFRSKRKWWLYYGKDHPTGHFKTRKRAVEWFNGGGR